MLLTACVTVIIEEYCISASADFDCCSSLLQIAIGKPFCLDFGFPKKSILQSF